MGRPSPSPDSHPNPNPNPNSHPNPNRNPHRNPNPNPELEQVLRMMGRLKHRMETEGVWDQTAYNEEMWYAALPISPHVSPYLPVQCGTTRRCGTPRCRATP